METISLERYNTGRFAYVVESCSVERQDIVELDEDVIFGGSLIGHFMVECLNHSWFDDFSGLWALTSHESTTSACIVSTRNILRIFFVARGFESVAMEKLQVEEQISLIMSADEIATSLGTLTHWAIFCKPTAKLSCLTESAPLYPVINA